MVLPGGRVADGFRLHRLALASALLFALSSLTACTADTATPSPSQSESSESSEPAGPRTTGPGGGDGAGTASGDEGAGDDGGSDPPGNDGDGDDGGKDRDGDGDGVADPDDDCPDEAGLISNAGCPKPVAEIVITSDPPGAEVRFGIQTVGNAVAEGTGRRVGRTPVTVELEPGDIVDDSPQTGCCQLYYQLQQANCKPTMAILIVSKDVVTEGKNLKKHHNLKC